MSSPSSGEPPDTKQEPTPSALAPVSPAVPEVQGSEPQKAAASATPQFIQEILSKVPPAQRNTLEQTFAMMVQQGPTPMVHPLIAKLDGTHVTKMLDGVEKEAIREHDDRDKDRSHLRFLAIVGLVGFLLISGLFLYMSSGELLKGILMGFAVFVGGLGFGSRFVQKKNEDE